MPIDRIEREIEARPFGIGLNKFGNIRKGTRDDATGKMADLSYFRVAFYPEYEDLIPDFDSLYGDQPTIIQPVFVIGDTATQAFDYWLEEHTKTKLVHQCDGKLQNKHYDASIGRVSNEPMACMRVQGGECGCREVGRFHVILPEFCRAVRKIGYFTVHTSSQYDIWALRGWFKDIETLHNGKVSGIPLILGRAPRDVPIRYQDKQGNWQRKIDTKHLLYLSPAAGYVEHVLMPGYTAAPYALANGEIEPETVTISRPALPENVPTPDEEMPEFVTPRNWDWDQVANRTSNLFDHPAHQTNAFEKMIEDGELTNDMDTMAAIVAVMENRRRRSMEKLNAEAQVEKPWNADPKAVAELLGAAMKKFQMNTGMVLVALSNAIPDNSVIYQNVNEFPGTKEQAWAGCLAYHCEYDPAKIESMLPRQNDATMRAFALEIAGRVGIAF